MNEADTCRKFVVPKLQAAGWDDRPRAINEQRTFTDSRSVFVGGKARRERRAEIVERLEEKGIDLDSLADAIGKPEADPFDLLCHLAYNAPLRTRRERADRLLREQDEFLARFGPDAREVLDAVLETYAEHGSAQFKLPDILEVPPFNAWGNVIEIAARFRGAMSAKRRHRAAVAALHRLSEGVPHWPQPPGRRLRGSKPAQAPSG